jgi:hypothetical protein
MIPRRHAAAHLLGLVAISVLWLQGCQPDATLFPSAVLTGPELPPTGQCVDFSDRVEGEEVDPEFVKDGFRFSADDGQPQLIYRTNTPGELGLQITQAGVKVRLPQPASRVVLRIVSYHSDPLRITAYDMESNMVDQVTAPATPQDTIHTVELNGVGIITLVIKDGGFDGVLVEVCIESEPEKPVGQCVDFSDLDNMQVDRRFEKDGFTFSAGQQQNIVTASTGERGLQLEQDGVRITLPQPASRVALRVEVHSTELVITALDASNRGVERIFIPGDNTVHIIELSGQEDITTIITTGGGGQTVLIELCINAEIVVEPEPQPGTTGRIAFLTFHPLPDCDHNGIGVMNIDGTGQDLFDDEFCDSSPSWSPDGTQIVLASALQNQNADIYVMNADGSGRTQLTNNPTNDLGPAWSPDGTLIVFTSDQDGDSDIYVMNVYGSGLIQLTNKPAEDRAPDWSPDGNRIVFASSRDGDMEIYVMNADGSGQTRLTTSPAVDADPAWSPDGTLIAFTSARDFPGGNIAYEAAEIYVMNVDGSGQTRLTNNMTGDFNADWSPDGTQIAFGSMRDGTSAQNSWAEGAWEIYVMNVDGSGQTRLTNNRTNETDPAWQP